MCIMFRLGERQNENVMYTYELCEIYKKAHLANIVSFFSFSYRILYLIELIVVIT